MNPMFIQISFYTKEDDGKKLSEFILNIILIKVFCQAVAGL